MAYKFARWLINFLTSKVVKLLAGEVVNRIFPDVGNVPPIILPFIKLLLCLCSPRFAN